MDAAAGGEGGGEALDHMSEGGGSLSSGVFFKGSITEAIVRAQKDDLVLIVFIAGENEESVSMELTTFCDSAVLDEVKKQSLILRLQEGSTDAAYFSAIFPLRRVPTITFLGYKGSLLHQLEGYQGAEEFLTVLRQAMATVNTQVQQARAASAMVALLSSANMAVGSTPAAAPEPRSAGNTAAEDATVQPSSNTMTHSVASDVIEVPPSQIEGSSIDPPGPMQPTVVTRSPVYPEAHPITAAGPLMAETRDGGAETGGSSTGNTNKTDSKPEATKSSSQVLKPDQSQTRTGVKQGNGKKTTLRRELSGTNQVKVRTGPFQVQIRLTNGETIQGTFESYQFLRDVKNFVDLQRTDGNMEFRLAIPFPRKTFTEEDMGKTLLKLDIGPRSALILVGNGNPTENSYHSRASANNDDNSSSQSEASAAGGSYVGRFLSFLSPYVYGRPGATQDQNSSSSTSHNDADPAMPRALREGSQPPMLNASQLEPPYVNPYNSGPNQENSAQAGRLSQRRGGSSNVHTLRAEDDDSSQGKNTYWNGNSTQFGANDEAKED